MSQSFGRPPIDPPDSPVSARYGRMFPWKADPLDPADLAAMERLATKMQAPENEKGRDNPAIPAAYTYFGQFVDHDLTFDLVSTLEAQTDPKSLWNFRTAALELDSIYGSGPAAAPYLFERHDRTLFKLGAAQASYEASPEKDRLQRDLPRTDDGTAIIADPRNDENLFVNQLHVAFLQLHNQLIEQFRRSGVELGQIFLNAQRALRRHYQWVVLHDYLPKIAGQNVIDDVLDHGRCLYDPGDHCKDPFIPIEFAVAAFRFGHSQIRDRYSINSFGTGPTVDPAVIPIFSPHLEWPPFLRGYEGPRDSLRGGAVRERDVVDWRFMVGSTKSQRSLRIRPFLSGPLQNLPPETFRGGGPPDLALRNLKRSVSLQLPDALGIAAFVRQRTNRCELLTRDQLWAGEFAEARMKQVPLWFYVLREAQLLREGTKLGPVGARIVAEVLIGLLQKDPQSILNAGAGFEPFEAWKSSDGKFGLKELLDQAKPA
ncbi:peroxidase family protein [Nevskia ramosa]|uniref:peroxidase family protein n=1 Tax=Nevskia ramosa TaxID=64002 RepID=UPI002352E7A6|nr:peroxidase family protein [Nevskia ramosa]